MGWNERRVFVTGASGIVGSWLVKRLLAEGAYVSVLVRDWDPQSELIRSGDVRRTAVVSGRLEDCDTLERALSRARGRHGLPPRRADRSSATALRSPLVTFEANVRGSYNLLEACRRQGSVVKRVVVASSDKAYGDVETLPYTEEMPVNGRHPYDVSKSCTDLHRRDLRAHLRPAGCDRALRQHLRRRRLELEPAGARHDPQRPRQRASDPAQRRHVPPRLRLRAGRRRGLSVPGRPCRRLGRPRRGVQLRARQGAERPGDDPPHPHPDGAGGPPTGHPQRGARGDQEPVPRFAQGANGARLARGLRRPGRPARDDRAGTRSSSGGRSARHHRWWRDEQPGAGHRSASGGRRRAGGGTVPDLWHAAPGRRRRSREPAAEQQLSDGGAVEPDGADVSAAGVRLPALPAGAARGVRKPRAHLQRLRVLLVVLGELGASCGSLRGDDLRAVRPLVAQPGHRDREQRRVSAAALRRPRRPSARHRAGRERGGGRRGERRTDAGAFPQRGHRGRRGARLRRGAPGRGKQRAGARARSERVHALAAAAPRRRRSGHGRVPARRAS